MAKEAKLMPIAEFCSVLILGYYEVRKCRNIHEVCYVLPGSVLVDGKPNMIYVQHRSFKSLKRAKEFLRWMDKKERQLDVSPEYIQKCNDLHNNMF